ncbi:MAG: DUF4838 domain-containing protein [Defluviitaleaceae bacterium]|nr:DUF4838 domain-containing protein [Defluviitaleaceae bacterium]
MLAKNKKPLAVIVTGPRPTETESYAAAELRHYLSMMTGAPFKIETLAFQDETLVSQDEKLAFHAETLAFHTETLAYEKKPDGNVIAVGSAAESLGVVFNPSDKITRDDAFVIKRVGGSIGVNGGKRGVIYGVYELLEQLGCRFFSPYCEKIPCLPELETPDIFTEQEPVVESRLHGVTDVHLHQRFAVKCRQNPGGQNQMYGGGIKYALGGHSFERLVPTDEYYGAHPEYFALINGERRRETPGLCLSNKEVLEIVIKNASAVLRENPDCNIISVSQNDYSDSYCTCPDCAAVDEYEGSHSGSVIRFVNQVAERLEIEFPQILVDTFAYCYSRPVPKHARARHNVCVRLCSIENCFSHPYETCDDKSRQVKKPDGSSTKFIDDLRDWGRVCERLYIWDYVTEFTDYPVPFPNWNVLQPNIRSLVKNNAKGIFLQGCRAHGYSTDLNELRCYLLSKLLWDADCDIERHRREFLEYYYGNAAGHIDRYIKALTDKVEKDNIHIYCIENCDKPHLTDEMLDVYEKILDEAASCVAGDPLCLMRTAKVKLSVRWVRIKNNAMLSGRLDPEEVNGFFTDWRAFGMSRIEEWVSAEETMRALLDGKWSGTEYLEHWWLCYSIPELF